MKKIRSIMDKALGMVCAIMLAFMTILATYQVVTRYAFNTPSTMSEDLLSYSFVWVSLLGTALVFGQKEHMKLTLFSDKLKGFSALALSIFTELLIVGVVIIVFLIGGQKFVGVGGLQASPTLNMTMDWIYLILPITGVLILIYNMLNITQAIQQYKGERKEEVQ
ncbi:TRAP transporter small permease [Planococcus glaciei]|uniref:TRAP transporter small permease n=1 Tax=Planococcus glaciei TaxID=459472 RepID=A0A7H8Q963_9BACL|nr:TRAP transporter small permease [Planococcus glaciei]ETP67328.1 hypothetical protein G159_19480 [Planococcus glaciei CHR43]QDY45140.1 TRAP transporter small permease [Planococcus glaciei]QKX50021.1 TRAP transporter small permease [Planococcus glaciei]